MKPARVVRYCPLAVLALLLAVLAGCSPADSKVIAPVAPVRLGIPGVENAFRVTSRFYSGSQPEGDAAFEALSHLGVRTIVSMDGAKPDGERARKYGLRYVHLPIGYDGVKPLRALQLERVASTIPCPVFVHCHHGKHRGPAAIAILCRAAEGWTTEQAESWLHEAGTGLEYPGLYRSVREFQPGTKEQLAGVGPLPEVAPSVPIVDAMVEIDEQWDTLKRLQQSDWAAPSNKHGLLPADEAALLREHFRELVRTNEPARRSSDYRNLLAESERMADALNKALRNPALDRSMVNALMKELAAHCTACHKSFRN